MLEILGMLFLLEYLYSYAARECVCQCARERNYEDGIGHSTGALGNSTGAMYGSTGGVNYSY